MYFGYMFTDTGNNTKFFSR